MPSDILVSIVIPAYNAQDFVADAVQSVLNQDYSPVELIVVDDGSTDQTAGVVRQFESHLTFHQQPNMGQSAAMNNGWRMSKGSILGYLSADDRLLPGAIRKTVEALVASPISVLAYPDFRLIDQHSRVTGIVETPPFSEERLVGELHCLPGPGALFRRDIFETVGGWNRSLRQIPDLEFFLRLAVHGPFVRVPEVLADFRIHSGSTTYRPAAYERAEEPLTVVSEFFGRGDLPQRLRHWQRASIANAYLLSAMIHGQSGRLRQSAAHLMRAMRTDYRVAFSRKAAGFVSRIMMFEVRRHLR